MLHSNHKVSNVLTKEHNLFNPIEGKIEFSQFGIYFESPQSPNTKPLVIFIPWNNISQINYYDSTD